MKYRPRRFLNHGPTRTTHLYSRVQSPDRPRTAPRRPVWRRAVPRTPAQSQPALLLEDYLPRTAPGPLPGRRAALPGTDTHRRIGATPRTANSRTGDFKKSCQDVPWPDGRKREVVMSLIRHYPTRLVCELLDFPRCQLYRQPNSATDEDAPLRHA